VKNQLHIKLESMLASFIPLSLVNPIYMASLSAKTITDDKSNRWVRNSDVAEFMMSEERRCIDLNQQHMALQRSDDNVDSNYKDHKGRL